MPFNVSVVDAYVAVVVNVAAGELLLPLNVAAPSFFKWNMKCIQMLTIATPLNIVVIMQIYLGFSISIWKMSSSYSPHDLLLLLSLQKNRSSCHINHQQQRQQQHKLLTTNHNNTNNKNVLNKQNNNCNNNNCNQKQQQQQQQIEQQQLLLFFIVVPLLISTRKETALSATKTAAATTNIKTTEIPQNKRYTKVKNITTTITSSSSVEERDIEPAFGVIHSSSASKAKTTTSTATTNNNKRLVTGTATTQPTTTTTTTPTKTAKTFKTNSTTTTNTRREDISSKIFSRLPGYYEQSQHQQDNSTLQTYYIVCKELEIPKSSSTSSSVSSNTIQKLQQQKQEFGIVVFIYYLLRKVLLHRQAREVPTATAAVSLLLDYTDCWSPSRTSPLAARDPHLCNLNHTLLPSSSAALKSELTHTSYHPHKSSASSVASRYLLSTSSLGRKSSSKLLYSPLQQDIHSFHLNYPQLHYFQTNHHLSRLTR